MGARDLHTLLLLTRVGLGGLALAAGYLLLRHVGCLDCLVDLLEGGDW